jgi:hypothetical protein
VALVVLDQLLQHQEDLVVEVGVTLILTAHKMVAVLLEQQVKATAVQVDRLLEQLNLMFLAAVAVVPVEQVQVQLVALELPLLSLAHQ